MTYVTGVLFRILHECFVTAEGAKDESAEERATSLLNVESETGVPENQRKPRVARRNCIQ
jgi:hypothetical protein